MKRLSLLLITGFFIVSTVVAVTQRQFLVDSYFAQTHTLQPEAAALLGEIDLTNKGRFLFKASRAEILVVTTLTKLAVEFMRSKA